MMDGIVAGKKQTIFEILVISRHSCIMLVLGYNNHTHTRTHNHFMALLDFVRDYPGELAPER